MISIIWRSVICVNNFDPKIKLEIVKSPYLHSARQESIELYLNLIDWSALNQHAWAHFRWGIEKPISPAGTDMSELT